MSVKVFRMLDYPPNMTSLMVRQANYTVQVE
jgi:hypothetical protein